MKKMLKTEGIEKTVQPYLNVPIPYEVREELKVMAARKHMTMVPLINEILIEAISKFKKHNY